MTPRGRIWLVAAIVVGGLVASIGVAQGPLRGTIGMREHAQQMAESRGWAPMRSRPQGPVAEHAALGMLLPIPRVALGTEVAVTFFAEDPATAAEPLERVEITVGTGSESAFRAELARAAEGAAFARISVSEQTRTITFGDEPRLHGGLMGLINDTVDATVTFYDGDPEDGAAALATLSFTPGVDSFIGFRSSVMEQMTSAAAAVVTVAPREMTLDLSAREPRRLQQGDGSGRVPGMGGRWR